MPGISPKAIVVDGRGHLMGRLSSIVAKLILKHTVAELDQRFLLTPPEARDAYLVQLVLSTREKQSKHSIIIFCKTCRTTELVGLLMTKVGVGSSVLHSMRAQKERTSSLAAFKSGQTKVLVATDVASRGLDIPQANLVINHSVPRDSVVGFFL